MLHRYYICIPENLHCGALLCSLSILQWRMTLSQTLMDKACSLQAPQICGRISNVAEYQIQVDIAEPISFAATEDPDSMYLLEARHQPDWPKYQTAVHEVVCAHKTNGLCELFDRKDTPDGMPVLPSVLSMKRKPCIDMREIYKWRAHLTVHLKGQAKPMCDLLGILCPCGASDIHQTVPYHVHPKQFPHSTD